MKKTHKNLFLLILFSFFVFVTAIQLQSFYLGSLQNKSANDNDSKWPSKRELRRKIWEIRRVLLIYGTRNTEFVEAYRDYAENYAHEFKWIEITVKPDSEVTSEEMTSMPVTVIGTSFSNAILAQLQELLPVKTGKNYFSIGKSTYSDETDVYVLSTYPNPLLPSLPISVISGNHDRSIVDFLRDMNSYYVRAGDFRVFRDGQGIVLGFFKQKKHGPWLVDYEKTKNYVKSMQPVLETEHYVFTYHGESVPRKDIEEFASQQEKRIKNILRRLNFGSTNSSHFPKIEYHLYESAEDKGLMTGNTDLSHFQLSKWQVHAIFDEDFKGDDFYSDARLLISKFVGKTKSLTLRDGLGMYFSDGWRKFGFRHWAILFYQTGNLIALQELLDSTIYKKESYLFMRPLAGSFVEFLIAKFGLVRFFDLYRHWPETGLPKDNRMTESLQDLEKGWKAHLEALEVHTVNQEISRRDPSIPEFQKGFCYAHEGYQIYNGYLSRESFESLKKLRALGVEWISLSPFGYLKHRDNPDYLQFSSGAGSENDESIIVAALMARKLGMRIMLKPHVLMHNWDWGWPGEINMKSEKEWEKFFEFYYRWIRHYALLAEMYQMDIFCIGVELVQATQGHEAQWQEMISKIRQIYHGPLVYAANWGEEFENLAFWDELDYLGLNCYYPLSNKNTATLEDLKKGTQQILHKIEKVVAQYQKPVLFTEVGFTSTAQSWQNPHERKRAAQAAGADQALAYRAVFETFWDQEWFYGFYWWKWPTLLEYGGQNHSGFTPNGKPAEKVVEEWYLKKVQK